MPPKRDITSAVNFTKNQKRYIQKSDPHKHWVYTTSYITHLTVSTKKQRILNIELTIYRKRLTRNTSKGIPLCTNSPQFRFPFSCGSRNPDGIGIAVIRHAPAHFIIPACLDLVEDRIARLDGDPVLRCQVRDALGLIQFSVDQVVRRLEFH